MHLASLQVFCDVARCRSFSRAADANHVTQSAVSQIVSQLEKRMQARLVDRSTRPLQLTAQGQTFYEGAKTILEQYRVLEATIRNAEAEIAGTVRVAAIYSVGLGDMGDYVERFQAALPNALVYVDYLHPDRVYERVLEGTADLGLVSFPRQSGKLIAVPWRDEEMVLAAAPSHPLARRSSVAPAQLSGEKYVHFDRNLVIRKEIDRFLREQDVTVDVIAEFDNIENIKQAVAVGAGVSLLPEPTLRREIEARTLAALALGNARLWRPLGIIHRRRPGLNLAARRFLELLRDKTTSPKSARNTGHNGFAKNGAHKLKSR
ncbi:MAG: LysR family transcriptional regulator [Planctomycetes bacterium]|nr:LysR family transcriptional regulator [Planctomycetota bacterium]